jgi:hypothetical protein
MAKRAARMVKAIWHRSRLHHATMMLSRYNGTKITPKRKAVQASNDKPRLQEPRTDTPYLTRSQK